MTFEAEQQSMLRAPFSTRGAGQELVGVEIEAGVVDPATGISVPYHGERGMQSLLRRIADRWQAHPEYESTNMIGLCRTDGTEIGLESGGALEYISTAEPCLVRLVEKVNRDISRLIEIVGEMDLALLSGAMLPFNDREHVAWMPKSRIPLMLDHFAREVGPTSQGWAAMAQITTVQTTIDFLDADDLMRKYRMTNAVSPLVAALFVNSPLQAGALADCSSRRMQIWTGVDTRRVGYFDNSLISDFTIDNLVSSVLELPMIYRVVDGKVHPAPHHRSFRSCLADGYGDGTYPSAADWKAMLHTTWPYVRVRDTIELRIADGPFQDDWPAAPALWVGLAYDRQACDAAWRLAGGHPAATYIQAVDDIALHGLDASIADRPVRALCRELLAIAQDGLSRRVEAGLEPESVLSYLQPLFGVVESGETFAQRQARNWLSHLARDPRRYVDAYRYK